MCGLCGVLGGPGDWASGTPEEGVAGAASWRAARHARLALINRVLAPERLSVGDWHGSAYLVRGATGRTEIVDTLPALWAAARAMLGRPIDPLDEAFLARLDA